MLGAVNAVVVLLYAAGLLLAARWLYVLRRWHHLAQRPVLTCAQFANAADGSLVIVAGRTAIGPLLPSPHVRQPYVWSSTVTETIYAETQNGVLDSFKSSSQRGDSALYDEDGGAAAMITPPVGKRRLFTFHDPLMVGPYPEEGRDMSGRMRTTTTWVVGPGVPIVATGKVRIDHNGQRWLDEDSWVDGSTEATPAQLPHRRMRGAVTMTVAAASCLAAALYLTFSA